MSHQRISILGFTLLLIMAPFVRAEESERDPDLPPKGYVHVEQSDLVKPKLPERDFKLKPYAERRGHWGVNIGFAYNAYNPSNYEPNFSGTDFVSEYGVPRSPLLEFQFTVKRNFSFGSVGLDFGGSNYYNAGGDGSQLKLYQMRVGGIFYLDTLFSDSPLDVPYASVGAYVINATETLNDNSVHSVTTPAPYVTVGAQFTLDWIDSVGAKAAYETGGLQSTFVFVEVRSYFASSNESDPNFGASFSPGGGLRVEF